MIAMLAVYQERQMYHECSMKLMKELAKEKRMSWKKVRKAMTLAAVLGVENQLY